MDEKFDFDSILDTFNGMDDDTRKIAISAVGMYVRATALKAELHDLMQARSMMDTCGHMTAALGCMINDQEFDAGLFDESISNDANRVRENRKRHTELQSKLDDMVRMVRDKEDELLPKLEGFLDDIIQANY